MVICLAVELKAATENRFGLETTVFSLYYLFYSARNQKLQLSQYQSYLGYQTL